uniref:Uncharacterized protein n=1 Tax=Nelumbo nucifera TaxID=4432 RepID=A0A822Z246_NELNU|nr:TPA_asm: hypothetical protein HUJ06_006198 [Nelumbo nucifera]
MDIHARVGDIHDVLTDQTILWVSHSSCLSSSDDHYSHPNDLLCSLLLSGDSERRRKSVHIDQT